MPQLVTQERSTKAPGDRFGKGSGKGSGGNKKSNSTNLIVGSLIAILILVSLFKMLTAGPSEKDTVPKTRVVAAVKDIVPGARIGFGDIRYVTIPNEYLTKTMFTKSNQVVGRISTIFVPKRNPIQSQFLHPANKTLSHTLENHERAVTIKLSEEGMVDHQLYPGDRVDVIVTASKNSEKYTKTICHNVKVLMAPTKEMVTSNGTNSRNQNRVTLAVLPDQAELITHAEQVGKPKLILRNRLATNIANVAGVGNEDLLPDIAFKQSKQNPVNLQAPVPPPEPVGILPDLPPVPDAIQDVIPQPVKNAAGWVVEVFSGSKRNTYEFSSPTATE